MDRRGFMKTIAAIGAGAILPRKALAKKLSQQVLLPYVILTDDWRFVREWREMVDITESTDYPRKHLKPSRMFGIGVYWGDDLSIPPTRQIFTIYLRRTESYHKGHQAVLVGRITQGTYTGCWLFEGEIVQFWEDVITNDSQIILNRHISAIKRQLAAKQIQVSS